MAAWDEAILAWGLKKLANVELAHLGSHQHEFSIPRKSVSVFEPFLGQRTFAAFHFLIPDKPVRSVRFVEIFFYDSRAKNEERVPEFRLYYPNNIEPDLEQYSPGDWLLFARDINQELHVLLWKAEDRRSADLLDFLWKRQRENTGEAWVEKFCSELGRLAEMPVARVDLCRDERQAMGILSEAFVWPDAGEIPGRDRKSKAFHAFEHSTFLPGNRMLSRIFTAYDTDKQWGQTDHTLANIHDALLAITESEQETARIFDLLLFDCWIGNTDRHHENWGLIVREGAPERVYSLAPAFDHGTALAATRLPEAKRTLLEERRVNQFYRKGRSGLYCDGKVLRSPDLARACFELELNRYGKVSAC